VAIMRSTPPKTRSTPETTILNRLDAMTMNRDRVCVLFTFVSDADAIHIPAITRSKKAASAILTPELCEKARSLTLRRCYSAQPYTELCSYATASQRPRATELAAGAPR